MKRSTLLNHFNSANVYSLPFTLSLMLLFFSLHAGEIYAGCQLSEVEAEFRKAAIKGDGERVLKMQENLVTLGYPLVMIDGIVGPETLGATTQFCDDFGFEVDASIAEGLDKALLHYSTIARAYPSWRTILLSGDFAAWINQQPAERQVAINKIKRSGTAEQIITLLELYSRQQGGGATSQGDAKRGPNFYYSLTSEDVDALEALLKPVPQHKVAVVPATAPLPQVSADDHNPEEGVVDAVQDAAKEESLEHTAELEPEPESIDELEPEPMPEPEPLIPALVIERLRAIQTMVYPTKSLLVNAITTQLGKEASLYIEHQSTIESKAYKGPFPTTGVIALGGSDCGCVRTMSGITYGFYPGWLANTKRDEPAQLVDFSTLSRIAYYGVVLDNKGDVVGSGLWDEGDNRANFIANAHKYGTKADLVFFSDSWQQWDELAMENAEATVVQRVVDQKQGRLDGITLYFDGFREYRFARVKINSFVKGLHEKLSKSSRSDITINLMLDLEPSSLKANESLLVDIKAAILGTDEDGQPFVDSIITFLEQPTTDTKKLLRTIIENEFKGIDRRNVFRKIIPVLTPNGHYPLASGAHDQFYDDLVYFQDNFAGIGFWPLPFATDVGSETVKEKVIDVFYKSSDDDFLKENADKYLPQLCQFSCPNRFYFRVAFCVLLGAFILYALFALWNYNLRNLFVKNIIYFSLLVGVLVLVFLISLVCDPYWSMRADNLALGLLFSGVVYVLWRYIGKMKQGPLP